MMQIKCKTGTKKLSLSKVVQIMLKYNKQKGISEPSEEKSPPQAKIFLDFAKYLSEALDMFEDVQGKHSKIHSILSRIYFIIRQYIEYCVLSI